MIKNNKNKFKLWDHIAKMVIIRINENFINNCSNNNYTFCKIARSTNFYRKKQKFGKRKCFSIEKEEKKAKVHMKHTRIIDSIDQYSSNRLLLHHPLYAIWFVSCISGCWSSLIACQQERFWKYFYYFLIIEKIKVKIGWLLTNIFQIQNDKKMVHTSPIFTNFHGSIFTFEKFQFHNFVINGEMQQ